MALIGIALDWQASGSGRSGSARYGMTIFVARFTALTWSQLAFSVPPKPQQLNISWIVLPLLLSAIAYGLDYGRAHAMNFGEAGVPNP